MTNDKVRFTLRVNEELYNALKAECKRTGVSLNALIVQILWEWLEISNERDGAEE